MGLYTTLCQRGDRASQPAANSVPEATLYFVTDEGVTERSDGASWESYSGVSAIPATFNGRLTGTTGVPVTTSDVTAIATIYLTAYKGKNVSLYDGSTSWSNYTLDSDVSLALTGLIVGVCYDLFLYDVTGTLTMEAVAWKTVIAGNSPSAGSLVTINLADTSTLVVGMDVTVRDGSNSEIARITTVTSNTSIVVDVLANSYTTPNVYGYRTRATALAVQDGVYVKTGATTRRYVGTLTMTATTGQTEDSASKRLVWNYYNRCLRPISYPEGTNSWNYSTATLRQQQGAKTAQVLVATGVSEDAVNLTLQVTMSNSTGTARTGIAAIGSNVTTAYIGNPTQVVGSNAWNTGPCAIASEIPIIGRNYYAWLEKGAGSDTQTWYGDNGSATGGVQTGITGVCLA